MRSDPAGSAVSRPDEAPAVRPRGREPREGADVANEPVRFDPTEAAREALEDAARAASTPARRRAPGRAVRTAYVLALIVGDTIAFAMAFVVAYQIHATMEQRPTRLTPLSDYLPTLAFQ